MLKNPRTFLKCETCGNIVGVVEDAGAPLVCCGKPMSPLTPNTVDASKEKHVPVATRDGNCLTVKIGAAPHPMTGEHHIAWVVAAEGPLTQRMKLAETGAPEAAFRVGDGNITVYAYCNLHGLWAAEVPAAEPIFGESVCSAEFSEGCTE